MFRHILITTDGSRLANKAVKAGIEFAAAVGAKITFYQAIEDNLSLYYSEGYAIPASALASIERQSRERAQKNLDAACKLAKRVRVSSDSQVGKAMMPWEGIIGAAKKKKCDVIFMASHGRRGLAGLLMGSVTQKVLTHSRVPVLVYR
jgi:nucleotide-binding universal stress UspA family protein